MTVPIASKNIQSTTAFKADIARLKFGLIKLICDKNPARGHAMRVRELSIKN